MGVKLLLLGDCQARLRELADNSVDSIVTDPPYGLSFMGKKWDYDVPSVEIWREALRVLKPGGHLLAFGGTRTYHRLVVAIEDAGFEIRDQVQWIYGQGFPKSLDISKAIDKAAGAERETVVSKWAERYPNGPQGSSSQLSQKGTPSTRVGLPMDSLPTTDAAKQWSGWGTALKPANEPICLARKPLEKGLTVAQNVLKWGTGGINIDGSRIGTETTVTKRSSSQTSPNGWKTSGGDLEEGEWTKTPHTTQGRFPANVILDEAAGEMLDTSLRSVGTKVPEQGASRFFYCAKASTSERNAGLEGMPERVLATSNHGQEEAISGRLGADPLARQAPRANFHPTVKPIKLMEYLIKLITPPGGTVLDCFMGSGTTGVAARRLGINFTGIELNPEYFEIARARIENGYRERV